MMAFKNDAKGIEKLERLFKCNAFIKLCFLGLLMCFVLGCKDVVIY
jgi:hypothetical protein